MALAYLSPETLQEMLGIIRGARNDLKNLSDTASMVSSALSKPQELNLKKKAFNQEGDESVLIKEMPTVGKVVDGRNHQLLARNVSGGRGMSRNFENPLGNFVEHMVDDKQHEVSVVENPKVKWYHDDSSSTATSPLPRKPPDPPDSIYGKHRKKGTIFPKYSCEEVYERMEMGLCVFCEEDDIPGHNLKHKGMSVLVTDGDYEHESILTEDDDEPTVEESFFESNEFVTETVIKPDSFSESVEDLTSDLQIVDPAGKEAQNESDAEEHMGLSLGYKIQVLLFCFHGLKLIHSNVDVYILNTWVLEVGELMMLITGGCKVKMKHELGIHLAKLKYKMMQVMNKMLPFRQVFQAVKGKVKMLVKTWWQLFDCFGVGLEIEDTGSYVGYHTPFKGFKLKNSKKASKKTRSERLQRASKHKMFRNEHQCISHETSHIAFYVWHRWKNKLGAEIYFVELAGNKTHENELLPISQKMQRSHEWKLCVCWAEAVDVKGKMERSDISFEWFHYPRPPEVSLMMQAYPTR